MRICSQSTGVLFALSVLSLLAAPISSAAGGDTTTLEEYVYTPDPAYGFALSSIDSFPGFTVYTLLMDSLQWRGPAEVDRTLWTHQVVVVVPDIVTTNTAMLLINGGSDSSEPVDLELFVLAAGIATSAQSVLAGVLQIPNQPLQFPDEPAPISEDALVAYSWDKAMQTGDASWAAYLPMTKASVRAMDAVQGFVNDTVSGVTIEDFVVTGFSKRGATAWLVAAVDPRVRAAAPGVFDILDMPLQIERHWQAYGFYSPAISDYVMYDIVGRVRSPEGQWLTGIVDPFSYLATLAIPKLIISSTGDQFFLPDAGRFYLDELPGETHVLQLPNTDHSLTNGEVLALNSLLAWYKTVLSETQRPVLDWSLSDAGVLEVTSDPPAQTAKLWQATNPDTRDFRLENIGAVWTDTALTETSPGAWQVTLSTPAAGWTGYLVELTFPGAGGPPAQTYTTPVFVMPDNLPFVLKDAVFNPRVARYWRCQLPDAPASQCPRAPVYTAAALESFLRVPLFGEYVNDLEHLSAIMATRKTADDRARMNCMATRLNIAAGKLDWYSPTRVDAATSRLWQVYARAEQAFADDDPVTASRLCANLNLAPAAALLPRR